MNVKERVALGSIAASAGLAAAKAVVGLLTGSLAILSEAGHSLIDLSATVLTYFAVRLSGKPADKEHQYGHGKVESVTALAETGAVVPALGHRDLGGGAAADRRAGACRRSDRRGVRHHRRLDRGRFFSRPHAAVASPRKHPAKRSKPTRCISAPTCGRRSRCWSGLAASRSAIRGPMPPRRSWSRCSSASPAGGSAGAPSIP